MKQIDIGSKPIRCPKCKSYDIHLREHIGCCSDWYPGDNEGYHTAGDYYNVKGHCFSCDHWWTIPKKIQMDDELKARLQANHEIFNINRGEKSCQNQKK